MPASPNGRGRGGVVSFSGQALGSGHCLYRRAGRRLCGCRARVGDVPGRQRGDRLPVGRRERVPRGADRVEHPGRRPGQRGCPCPAGLSPPFRPDELHRLQRRLPALFARRSGDRLHHPQDDPRLQRGAPWQHDPGLATMASDGAGVQEHRHPAHVLGGSPGRPPATGSCSRESCRRPATRSRPRCSSRRSTGPS